MCNFFLYHIWARTLIAAYVCRTVKLRAHVGMMYFWTWYFSEEMSTYTLLLSFNSQYRMRIFAFYPTVSRCEKECIHIFIYLQRIFYTYKSFWLVLSHAEMFWNIQYWQTQFSHKKRITTLVDSILIFTGMHLSHFDIEKFELVRSEPSFSFRWIYSTLQPFRYSYSQWDTYLHSFLKSMQTFKSLEENLSSKMTIEAGHRQNIILDLTVVLIPYKKLSTIFH